MLSARMRVAVLAASFPPTLGGDWFAKFTAALLFGAATVVSSSAVGEGSMVVWLAREYLALT